MELQITTKNNLKLTEEMQRYVEMRIGKLSRYLPSISEGKVEVSNEGYKLPDQRFTLQVTLDSNGVLIRSQERGEDIRTATDKVVDALTNRIERYKGKLYDKGRGVSVARQGVAAPGWNLEVPKKVVKSKRFLVKPMSLEEAINQMELLGHDFFLFIDADTDVLNLLYRRKDGNYGLIEAGVE